MSTVLLVVAGLVTGCTLTFSGIIALASYLHRRRVRAEQRHAATCPAHAQMPSNAEIIESADKAAHSLKLMHKVIDDLSGRQGELVEIGALASYSILFGSLADLHAEKMFAAIVNEVDPAPVSAEFEQWVEELLSIAGPRMEALDNAIASAKARD